MKHRTSIIRYFNIFGYTWKSKYRNLPIIIAFDFSSLLTIENAQNYLLLEFLIFNFTFWQNIPNKEKHYATLLR
jgi:hypothetical protein